MKDNSFRKTAGDSTDGQHLMLKLNGNEQQGYTGTFNIGVNAN
jgi:hypothetical protein